MKRKALYFSGFIILMALSLYSAFQFFPNFLEQSRQRQLEEKLSALAVEDEGKAF